MIGKSTTILVSLIAGLSGPLGVSAEESKIPLPAPASAKASTPASDSSTPASSKVATPAADSSTPSSSIEMTPAAAASSAPTLKPEVKQQKIKSSRHQNERKNRTGVLAYIAGSAAEAPAAVYRQSARELDAGVKDLTNDSTSPVLRVPATLISLPFSIVAGCVEGALYAVRYRNSNNCPDNMKR